MIRCGISIHIRRGFTTIREGSKEEESVEQMFEHGEANKILPCTVSAIWLVGVKR
ncbi:hypothetical protein ES702_01071 [subsurface metagenome]